MAEIAEPVQSPFQYQEGQKARGPNGELAVFTNGKWEVKDRTVEDIKNIAGPATVRGLAGLASAPRGYKDAMGAGADWILSKTLDKILPTSVVEKANAARRGEGDSPPDWTNTNFWPDQQFFMDQQKKLTGRDFNEQAETPVGKVVQTGLELAPSVAAGPGSLARKGTMLATTTGGAEIGEAVGGQTGRVLGSLAGTFAPATARRIVTPRPITDPQLIAENKIMTDAGLQQTAGQYTKPGGLLDRVEGYNIGSAPANLSPAGQSKQFGQFAHQQAGVVGPRAKEGISDAAELANTGNKLGQRIEAGYAASTPVNDRAVLQGVSDIYSKATPATQAKLAPHAGWLAFGPGGTVRPPNTPLGGPATRKEIKALDQLADKSLVLGDKQTAGAAQAVGSQLRGAVDRSLVGTSHQNMPQRRVQYTNQVALENLRAKQGGTRTAAQPPKPRDVYSALGGTKNPKAQQNRLGRVSDIAGQRGFGEARNPLELKDRLEHSVFGMFGGGAGGAGIGHLLGFDPPTSAILGSMLGGAGAFKLVSNPVVGNALLNNYTQNWLKNQKWMPGPNSKHPTHNELSLLLGGQPGLPEEE